MADKIKDSDRGARQLAEKVFGLNNPKIVVGILARGASQHVAKPGASRAISILEYATWNEFGVKASGIGANGRHYVVNIPERSFIRAWFDHNRLRALDYLAAVLKEVIAGNLTKEQALNRLAQKFVAEIKIAITRGIDPPNADSTIERKGSSKPLIDTGALRSAISYRIDYDNSGGPDE